MKKSSYVVDLKAKDEVKSLFLVKYIALLEGKDGKPYLSLILQDKSGELECRKWQGGKTVIDEVSVGQYVYVEGKINQFQNRLQLIVEQITLAPQDVIAPEEYAAKSNTPPEKMFNELLSYVEKLPEVYIKDLLLLILNDGEIQRRLKVWPAGKTIHHAYQSGLLEHILSCTKLAHFLAPHYQVNLSYVVSGTILHDLCKIYELSDGPIVDYTEEGKLVGHLVKALEIVDHYAAKIKNFPYQQKLHIKHILLSHHGEYEYGSPKIPQTSEAFLVHLIDLMDSKMHALETIKKNDHNVGHWSSMVRHLDRIIYKNSLPSFTEHFEASSVQTPTPNATTTATVDDLLKKFQRN